MSASTSASKSKCLICSGEFIPRNQALGPSLFTYMTGLIKYLGLDFEEDVSTFAKRPVVAILCRTCQVDVKWVGEFDRKLADLNFFIEQLQEQVVTNFKAVSKKGEEEAPVADSLNAFILHLQEQILANFKAVDKHWDRLRRTVDKFHANRKKGRLGSTGKRTRIRLPTNPLGKGLVNDFGVEFVLLEKGSLSRRDVVLVEEAATADPESVEPGYDSGGFSPLGVSSPAADEDFIGFDHPDNDIDNAPPPCKKRPEDASSIPAAKPKVKPKPKSGPKSKIRRTKCDNEAADAEQLMNVNLNLNVKAEPMSDSEEGEEEESLQDFSFSNCVSSSKTEIKDELEQTGRLTRTCRSNSRGGANTTKIEFDSSSDSASEAEGSNDEAEPADLAPDSSSSSESLESDFEEPKKRKSVTKTPRKNAEQGERKPRGRPRGKRDVSKKSSRKSGGNGGMTLSEKLKKADTYLGLFDIEEDGTKSYYGIKVEESTTSGSFKCGECGHKESPKGSKSANSVMLASSKIRQHINEKHTTGYKCHICARVMPVSYRQLVIHLSKHGTRTCEICGRVLNRHREGLELAYQRCLWSHKNEEEKKAAIAAGEKEPPPKKRSGYLNPVQCNICGKILNRGLLALQRHQKKFHENNPEEKLPCPDCGKLYYDFEMNVHYMNVHTKAYRKRYPCTKCSKIFLNSQQYKDHFNKYHLGMDQSYQCHVCGRAFAKNQSLKDHLWKEHEGKQKEHFCTQCDKAFWRNCELQNHIQAQHVGSADHTCKECGKAFDQKSALKRHMAKHGEAYYKTFKKNPPKPMVERGECDICGKDLNKYSIKRHKAICHGAGGNGAGKKSPHVYRPSASCIICGKGFLTKHYVTKHIAKYHPEHVYDPRA